MELTIEQALQQAVEYHKAGKLQDAEALYRAILQTQPNHPDANHNLGVMAVSLNKTEAALPLFKTALEANPSQGQFWLNYIDALIQEKQFDNARNVLSQGKKAGLVGERVDALESQLATSLLAQEFKSSSNQINLNQVQSPSQVDINTLLELYQRGRYQHAENLAREITKKNPDHQFSWKVLGSVLHQMGRLQDSLIANQRAIKLSPDDMEVHNNLGITLKDLGKLEDAEASYKKAIAIMPEFAEAYNNLGLTLQDLGRLEEAETCYKKAIESKPEYAEAYNNLGLTLHDFGRIEEAVKSYKKAIAIKPDYAEAHSNLGVILQDLGRLEEAETCFKNAIAIKSEFAEAHSNLGITLQELGRLEDALTTVIKSIKIKPILETKRLFVQITKKIDVKIWNQSLADLVINALLEPWGRPYDLMPIACRLLKADKEFVQILNQSEDHTSQARDKVSFLSSISKKEFNASSLLQAMLSSSAIPDAEIERFLTLLRHLLLKVAASETLKEADTEALSPLYCSLAKQCFINEYVYFQTAEEIDLSHQLRDRLIKALEEGSSVSADLLITVACYFPLYSVIGVEKLLNQKWADDIKSVLRIQIQEPFEELNLRKSIPILTRIDNQVSLAVQSQYEENPYPRWVRVPKESSKIPLNSYIQSKFRLSAFNRLGNDLNAEILIAGCGTGQHPIGTSQTFKGGKILAVDLSMASLAYAKRKTVELDIHSVDYAQADLIKLASIGRTFDVIESVGVLHHLENPFEGWEVLLSLLRPNGLMRLGFYSELARGDIVRVRNLISKAGIGSSSKEIRDFRQYLLELKDFEDHGFAASFKKRFNLSMDFFSTSECCDLFFHVQEHRMNLKILSDFLKDHNLNFLGFEIDSSVIRSYKNRFSNDPSATNLNQWQIYEEENPNTFIGMYQFWIQKN